MNHEIQIIIDNAGGINLKIDNWYCQYNSDSAIACVSDIIEAQGMCLDEAWGDWIDGYDADLADCWEMLEDPPDNVVINSSDELTEGVGHAGKALRLALEERSVTF